MIFYQACYGKPGNNWQLLNVSKDIPPYMASFFENTGNNCTPQNIGSDTLTDKQGNQVVLYELISADNVICVVRAKYGERDNYGRPKMFAHGFLFPAEGAYREPADYLSLADSNFHFSDAETASIPSQLNFDAKLNLNEALSICGIKSFLNWQQLMKCIYAILSSATDYPLYIRCDGNLNKIKATILCILSALPYSLRYRLSFSNANSLSYAKFKRVMFIETIPDGSYYFDLESGDTNLLSEVNDIDQYPENYAAYHVFCSRCKSVPQLKNYFDSIQSVLDSLSFGYVTEMDEVNLAHLFANGVDSVDSMNNAELMKLLLELLVKSPMKNTFADDYIAGLLEKFDNRTLIPTDSILKRIESRSDKTSSVHYINVYKKIKMRALLSKGQNEAVIFLGEQYRKNKSIFNEWAHLILNIPDGKKAVDLFFDKKIKECQSYEDIDKINKDALEYYENSRELIEAVISQIKSIAQNKIFNSILSDADFEFEVELLKRQTNQICSADNKKYFDAVLKDIIFEFWHRFDYSKFEFNERCVYNCASMNPNGFVSSTPADNEICEKYYDVSLLLDVFELVAKYKKENGNIDYWDVEQAVSIFNDKNTIPKHEEDIIIQKLQEFLLESMYCSEGKRHFSMWLKFIQLGGKRSNPILTFICWKLPVVCDSECFEKALRESERMSKSREMIGKWLFDAVEHSESYCISDENVKALKCDIKVIHNINKEISMDEKRKEHIKKENKRKMAADERRGSQVRRTKEKQKKKEEQSFLHYEKIDDADPAEEGRKSRKSSPWVYLTRKKRDE